VPLALLLGELIDHLPAFQHLSLVLSTQALSCRWVTFRRGIFGGTRPDCRSRLRPRFRWMIWKLHLTDEMHQGTPSVFSSSGPVGRLSMSRRVISRARSDRKTTRWSFLP